MCLNGILYDTCGRSLILEIITGGALCLDVTRLRVSDAFDDAEADTCVWLLGCHCRQLRNVPRALKADRVALLRPSC